MSDKLIEHSRSQFKHTSRRDFLRSSGMGFGWLAFASLVNPAFGRGNPGVPDIAATSRVDIAPRAKRVIFLFMDGGVSHVDSFDPKPKLSSLHGQPATWRPDPLSQAVSAGRKWLGSPWKFKRH